MGTTTISFNRIERHCSAGETGVGLVTSDQTMIDPPDARQGLSVRTADGSLRRVG